MKKLMSVMLGVAMLLMVLQPVAPAEAASSIRIYVDGAELKTDQGAAMINYRVLVPLRAIFEALDAKVVWNQKTETIVAKKGDTTVTLTVGSNAATVNNSTVYMDVPAKKINNRTLVPIRFVTEALGDEVRWDEAGQRIFIQSSSKVFAPTGVNASIVDYQGNGQDIEISFSKAKDETNVSHYRAYIVKSTNKTDSFSVSQALAVSSGNYTWISRNGTDKKLRLASDARDTDGQLIQADQSYTLFVLAVGNESSKSVLGQRSGFFTLKNSQSSAAATNVVVRSSAYYGDGRDLGISFTKAVDETYVAGYRVYVVKEQDVKGFTVPVAARVPASNYTAVSKASANTLSVSLGSTARDSSGDLIRTGVSYRVFVLSVTNNVNKQGSQLSSGSAPTAVGNVSTAPSVPFITSVDNAAIAGDGRDVTVQFTRSSDEAKVGSYRIFAVRSNVANSFDLQAANQVKSSNYTTVNKTGSNLASTLSSSTRDTQGNYLQRGQSYRFFVMAVGNANANQNSSLSASSNLITLTVLPSVSAPYNVSISDTSDYGDGRDMTVQFTRPSNEQSISHYRIMIVKAKDAGSFTLATANSMGNANYTVVNTGGASTIRTELSSSVRDSSGDFIRSGVSYRAFVLAVSSNSGTASNRLSSASSALTLTESSTISAPSISKVEDVSDYGDGRDIRVSFNRSSDESKVNLYRIFVVRGSDSLSLWQASNMSYANYFDVYKNGSNQSVTLPTHMRDTDGNMIVTGQAYRIYVMAVGNDRANYQNALSSASSRLTLTNNQGSSAISGLKVSDISDYGDGRDLLVSFNKSSSESTVNHYRVLVVKAAQADNFTLADAVNVAAENVVLVPKTGNNYSLTLPSNARDVDGAALRNGVSYKVLVLSVNEGSLSGSSALSTASAAITLSNNAPAAAGYVSSRSLNQYGDSRDFEVTYGKPNNDSNIAEYRILLVRADQASSFDLLQASNVSSSNYTVASRQGSNPPTTLARNAKDYQGNAIVKNASYRAYVLSVGDQRSGGGYTLSAPSNDLILTELSVDPAVITNVENTTQADGAPLLNVSFQPAGNEANLAYYAVMAVPTNWAGSFTLSEANSLSSARYTQVVKTGRNQTVQLGSSTLDIEGNKLVSGSSYRIYVLSIADGRTVTANALSAASQDIVMQ